MRLRGSLLACALVATLAATSVSRANVDPATCDALVAALPAALEQASEFVVAVTLEQGGREVAFERSRVTRQRDGSTVSTTLERRGLRRPGNADDAPAGSTPDLTLPCDDHDLDHDADGVAHLTLRDDRPDAPVSEWSLQFEYHDGRWRPLALSAPFTVRVMFVPVRGRFVTTFEGWAFDEVR